jgi:hypothetical protein
LFSQVWAASRAVGVASLDINKHAGLNAAAQTESAVVEIPLKPLMEQFKSATLVVSLTVMG